MAIYTVLYPVVPKDHYQSDRSLKHASNPKTEVTYKRKMGEKWSKPVIKVLKT